jgi:hypothetical protein
VAVTAAFVPGQPRSGPPARTLKLELEGGRACPRIARMNVLQQSTGVWRVLIAAGTAAAVAARSRARACQQPHRLLQCSRRGAHGWSCKQTNQSCCLAWGTFQLGWAVAICVRGVASAAVLGWRQPWVVCVICRLPRHLVRGPSSSLQHADRLSGG